MIGVHFWSVQILYRFTFSYLKYRSPTERLYLVLQIEQYDMFVQTPANACTIVHLTVLFQACQ